MEFSAEFGSPELRCELVGGLGIWVVEVCGRPSHLKSFEGIEYFRYESFRPDHSNDIISTEKSTLALNLPPVFVHHLNCQVITRRNSKLLLSSSDSVKGVRIVRGNHC